MKDITEEEYLKDINDSRFVEEYPIPLENFGKDFLNSLCMLQSYKRSYENSIALRMSANTIRKILMNCTQQTFDICKIRNPYPAWQKVSEHDPICETCGIKLSEHNVRHIFKSKFLKKPTSPETQVEIK